MISLALWMMAVWESCCSASSFHSASFSTLAAEIYSSFSIIKALKAINSSLSFSLETLIGVRAAKRSFNSWILFLVAAISSTNLAKSSTHWF
jgi:hypothetical protein